MAVGAGSRACPASVAGYLVGSSAVAAIGTATSRAIPTIVVRMSHLLASRLDGGRVTTAL
jgi:hypothetical protein